MPNEDLKSFIQFIKEFSCAISFTSHTSVSSANCLDITVAISLLSRAMSFYNKLTDALVLHISLPILQGFYPLLSTSSVASFMS